MSENNDDLWGDALAEQAASLPSELTSLGGAAPAAGSPSSAAQAPMASSSDPKLELVEDIPVEFSVEIGRAKLSIGQILRLSQGSVVELDVMAGEPLNVYVNGVLIAQGEVVVINDKFGIRLTDVLSPAERARRMSRVA